MKRIAQILLTLPLAAQLFAGGFWVEPGSPSTNAEALKSDAVFVARLTGCHDPGKASLTATAEGVVNGQTQSVTLHPIPLSTPGAYAVKREWPAEGAWAVKVVAATDGLTRSFVVRMGRGGFDQSSVKYFQRNPSAEEIAAVIGNKG